jgi:hypothetical protein
MLHQVVPADVRGLRQPGVLAAFHAAFAGLSGLRGPGLSARPSIVNKRAAYDDLLTDSRCGF